MKDIIRIFIVDRTGNVLYTRGGSVEETDEMDPSVLSAFISTFQLLAAEMGKQEMKVAKLGQNVFFCSKDMKTEISIVIKCSGNVKKRKIRPFLEKIKNLFLSTMANYIYTEGEVKQYLMESFSISLTELLKSEEEKASEFFNGLRT